MAIAHAGIPPEAAAEDEVVADMSEIDSTNNVEYATCPGFKDGQTLRIGSLTAGDFIEWQEANKGDAKRTAGLRLICKSLVGPEPENRRYALHDRNIQIFRGKSHRITENIVKAVLKLNGIKVKGIPDEDDTKND
jgi:hypothetical protein